MKYAIIIYKCYSYVSFQYHLMDLQYHPSILAVNTLQLQSKTIVYVPSCRINMKFSILSPTAVKVN